MTTTKPRAARTKRKAPRKRAQKKTASTTAPGTWNSEEAKTPAALTRASLLANVPDAEIRAAVAKRFPGYKALDICVSVYRRELRKSVQGVG